MNEPVEFKGGSERIERLQKLTKALRACAAGAGLLAIPALWPYGLGGQIAGLAAAVGMLGLSWRFDPSPMLKAASNRTLRFTSAAIEINHESFTRFVVYEDILQVKVYRRKDDSIASVLLVTAEGPFVIRDFVEMEMIFGHLAERKPEKAMIQIEPAPWWR